MSQTKKKVAINVTRADGGASASAKPADNTAASMAAATSAALGSNLDTSAPIKSSLKKPDTLGANLP